MKYAGGEIMSSTHTTTMHLPICIKNNIEGHVLPDLKPASLLSIWQFCDNGCSAYFNKNKVYIIHNNTKILEGHRKNSNGMWIIPVPIKSSTATTNLQNNKNKHRSTKFYQHTNNNVGPNQLFICSIF